MIKKYNNKICKKIKIKNNKINNKIIYIIYVKSVYNSINILYKYIMLNKSLTKLIEKIPTTILLLKIRQLQFSMGENSAFGKNWQNCCITYQKIAQVNLKQLGRKSRNLINELSRSNFPGSANLSRSNFADTSKILSLYFCSQNLEILSRNRAFVVVCDTQYSWIIDLSF